MKIALVHLINYESDVAYLPLNLAGIASYIRVYGGFNDIRIIGKDIVKSIRDYKPDVIGMSVVSHQYHLGNSIAGEIKKITDKPLIIGGPHITALPEQIESSNFDIGVVGEGEETFLELLKYYEKNKKMASENLKKMNGLVFKDKFGKAAITKKRELIKDLDKIPSPDLELLKIKEGYGVPGHVGTDFIGVRGVIMTSRGCPYNCLYCGSNTVWGRNVRWQSAERVIKDIKTWVNNYGSNHFMAYDDIMIANTERFRKIVYLLEREGLTKKIKFDLFARANLINEEMCKLLKRINACYIFFGLESGSEKILNYLKRGTVTVEQGKKAMKMCKEHGFIVNGYFMIGSPGETNEDLEETRKFIESLEIDFATIFITTPLPGTELWDYALKENFIKKDFYEFPSRDSMVKFQDDLLLSKEITKEEFKEWYELLKKKGNKDIKPKLKFNLPMLKFLFYSSFYSKLWKKREYIPGVLNRI